MQFTFFQKNIFSSTSDTLYIAAVQMKIKSSKVKKNIAVEPAAEPAPPLARVADLLRHEDDSIFDKSELASGSKLS